VSKEKLRVKLPIVFVGNHNLFTSRHSSNSICECAAYLYDYDMLCICHNNQIIIKNLQIKR
jgi:hypothetical protein